MEASSFTNLCNPNTTIWVRWAGQCGGPRSGLNTRCYPCSSSFVLSVSQLGFYHLRQTTKQHITLAKRRVRRLASTWQTTHTYNKYGGKQKLLSPHGHRHLLLRQMENNADLHVAKFVFWRIRANAKNTKSDIL